GGGQEAMLKRFHVQTRETNGELRDSVILMREYDAALKKEFPGGSGSLGYATRLQFEKDSGLPETFARSLNNPELQKWIDDSKKRAEAFGLNDPKNVENAKNFELAIRGLKNEIDDLGLSLAADLWKDFGGDIENFGKWLEDHHEEIKKTLEDWARGIKLFAEGIIAIIKPVANFIDKQIGWNVAGEIFAGLLVLRIVPGLQAMLGLVTSLGLTRLPAWLAAMLGIPVIGAAAVVGATGALVGTVMPQSAGVASDLDSGATSGQRSQFEQDHPILSAPQRWWRKHMPTALGGG